MDINLFRKSLASKQGLLKEDHAIETAKSLLAKAAATLKRKNNEDTAEEAAAHIKAVKDALKKHPIYGMDLNMRNSSSSHTLEWFLDSAEEAARDALGFFNRGSVNDGQKTLVLCKDEVDDILYALDVLF